MKYLLKIILVLSLFWFSLGNQDSSSPNVSSTSKQAGDFYETLGNDDLDYSEFTAIYEIGDLLLNTTVQNLTAFEDYHRNYSEEISVLSWLNASGFYHQH